MANGLYNTIKSFDAAGFTGKINNKVGAGNSGHFTVNALSSQEVNATERLSYVVWIFKVSSKSLHLL